MEAKMFESRIDIPSEDRMKLIDLLNGCLADVSDLISQTKQAHWNVKGSDFIQLHEMYDQFFAELVPAADTIAERATTLGGEALGTVRMAAANSTLPEYPTDSYCSMDSVDALADRYALVAKKLRVAADEAERLRDMDTNDMFIEISRMVDKQLWFLEAHLQKAR